MNNRIMAMLCALVAAMFLSIVPVKAEAAVAKHDHYDNNKNCVCDFSGCKEQVHNWSSGYGFDAESHWKNCLNGCGAVEGKEAHDLEYKTDGKGNHTATCKVCEKTIDSLAAAHVDEDHDCECDVCHVALPHDLELVAAVKPTCEKAGIWAHNKCKTCGKLFSKDTGDELTEDQIVHAALGHNWSKSVSCDDDSHYYRCQNEGCEAHKDEEAHTFEYKSNGDGTHSAKCTFCGRTPETLQDVKHVDEDHNCECDVCKAALPHKLELVKAEAATCEKDGVVAHQECTVCGKFFYDGKGTQEMPADKAVIPALGHKANGKWENDEDGFHYQWCAHKCGTKLEKEDHVAGEWKLYPSDNSKHFKQCSVCYKTLETEDHKYEYVYVNKDYHKAVCETCGYDTGKGEPHVDENGDCKCDGCGAEMPHAIDDLTKVDRVEPACEKEGNKGYLKCEHCGKVFNLVGTEITAEDIAIPATGHDWKYIKFNGDKHLVQCKNANCDLDGQATIIDHEDTDGDCKCDLNGCGQLVHSHRLVIHAEVPATCEEDGTEAYYTYQDCGKMFDLDQNPIKEPKVIKATGHDMSGKWVPGENGQHIKKCANCDYFEAEDHVFKNGNVTCAICGAEENLTFVEAKDATCTEQGNVAYWTSKVTNKKYADEAGTKELKDVTVPATGHELTGFVDNGDGKHSQHCQNPGCKYEEGNALHRAAENGCYCVDCGGALDGHELTLVKAIAATCEKAGTEAYFQCSCGAKYDLEGQSIVKPAAIAKLAHTTNGKVCKDAKEGKHYTECTTCGKKFYEEHVMAVEDPMKGNYHQYVCECGELKVEQHYDKDGDKFCDVCNHSMSSSSVTVEQHDSVTVKTGDASTINKHYTWWRNWLEALFPSNSGGTVASAQKTEETSAASSQTVAPAANSASQNTNQNTTASSDTTAGETVVNTNALTQFVSWFLGLFGF